MNTDKAKAEGMKNREDFLLALAGRTPGWPSGMANSMDERTFACQKPNVHGCVEKNTSPLLRSEEHTSELQSLMRISYAVFCLKKKKRKTYKHKLNKIKT